MNNPNTNDCTCLAQEVVSPCHSTCIFTSLYKCNATAKLTTTDWTKSWCEGKTQYQAKVIITKPAVVISKWHSLFLSCRVEDFRGCSRRYQCSQQMVEEGLMSTVQYHCQPSQLLWEMKCQYTATGNNSQQQKMSWLKFNWEAFTITITRYAKKKYLCILISACLRYRVIVALLGNHFFLQINYRDKKMMLWYYS